MLRGLTRRPDPRLLVGFDHADDAAVVRLSDDLALVFTTDFFPPMIEDPRVYGRIAAANALSDVYAMGGTPLVALNLVTFPSKKLPPEVLTEVLEGAGEVCALAGCAVGGGHTVTGDRLEFGLAVAGTVHPDRIATSTGLVGGEFLVLTKPLGTGILTTAMTRGVAGSSASAATLASMAELNRVAGEAIARFGLRAATDVTGFGLLGHLRHLVEGSARGAEIWGGQLPLLPEVRLHAGAGLRTGGAARNRAYVEAILDLSLGLPDDLFQVALDPQTSGGMLLAVPGPTLDEVLSFLEESGTPCRSVIGRVDRDGPGRIRMLESRP